MLGLYRTRLPSLQCQRPMARDSKAVMLLSLDHYLLQGRVRLHWDTLR